MMRKVWLGTAAACALLAPLGDAQAITVRDDVAAAAGGMAEYYDSGNLYPNAASLRLTEFRIQNCSGSLINARTVLTAAHCLYTDDNPQETGEDPDLQGRSTDISFDASGARTPGIAAASALPHPGYDGAIPTNDIAIVALSRPVTSLTPVQLAGAQAATGGTVVMVGYGSTYLASLGFDPATEELNPVLIGDERRRVAFNVLDFVGEASAMPESDWPGQGVILGTDIDIPQVELSRLDPDEENQPAAFSSLGDAAALAIEGGVEPGDSGGPLFLLGTDGSVTQVGVATAIGGPSDALALFSTDPYAGGYGSQNIWIGVLAYLDWIGTNAFLRSASALAGNGLWSNPTRWSGGTVPDNSSGYVAGGAARYYDVSLDQAGTTILDMDATVDTLTVNNDGATLALAAPWTLTTEVGTTVAAGQVDVAGTLVAPWLRLSGGTMSGTGIVTADLSQDGGTLSPGGAGTIGTLTVGGAVTQSGGVLLAELSADAADLLDASGAVRLAGGLRVALLGATPPADGASFTLVQGASVDAAGLVAPDSIGAVSFSLTRTATGLQVVVGRETLTGHAKGATGRAVAAALDGARGQVAFAGLFDSLDVLPAFQMGQALEQLGGASTTAGATSRLTSAQFLGAASQRVGAVRAGSGELGAANRAGLRALLSPAPEESALLASAHGRAGERLARPRLSGPTDGQGATLAEAPVFALGRDSGFGLASTELRWGVWAQPYGVRAARRGDAEGDRWDTTIGGLSGGVDYLLRGDGVAEGLLVGASLGYARADTDYREVSDEVKSRAWQAGLYGGWWRGPWSADVGLGMALNRYKSRRDLNFGTTNATAEGRYDGHEFSAYAEARYRHGVTIGGPGRLDLEPLVGLQALRLATDGYTESGAGAMNLSVASGNVTSLRSSLGAAIAYPVTLADGTALRPELRARWSHEFGDTNDVVDASFAAAGGGAFRVASADLGRDAALLGAGVEARLGPRLHVSAAYDVQLQQGYSAQAVTGRVRVAF